VCQCLYWVRERGSRCARADFGVRAVGGAQIFVGYTIGTSAWEMRARRGVVVNRQAEAAERLRAYAASSSAVRKLAPNRNYPEMRGGD